jgi:tRNA-Thr(GGU) m(6)t(6)A37 methyltransferase TsaA
MRSSVKNAGLSRLRAIGIIRSTIKTRAEAPRQGSEGAPDAWVEVISSVAQGLEGLKSGDEIIVLTWLHKARRDTLQVHPRSDRSRPLTGVFATRSPDRPNPLGLHLVTVRRIIKNRLLIGPIEAIDGTPVVDIKPVIKQQVDGSKRGRCFPTGRKRLNHITFSCRPWRDKPTHLEAVAVRMLGFGCSK